MVEHRETGQHDDPAAADAMDAPAPPETTDPFFESLIQQIIELETPDTSPAPAPPKAPAHEVHNAGESVPSPVAQPRDRAADLDALESEFLEAEAAPRDDFEAFDAEALEGEMVGVDELGAAADTNAEASHASSEPQAEPSPDPTSQVSGAPVAAGVPVDEPPAAEAANQANQDLALKPLDDAIVDEADSLLAGDFESVEDMLDEAVLAGSEGVRGSTGDLQSALEPPSIDLPPIEPSPIEPAPSKPAPVEPAPVLEVASKETTGADRPSPAKRVPGRRRDEPIADPEQSSEDGTAETGGFRILGLLRRINHPVSSMSPSARMIIDLLAISLLLWIPIVWIIALFMVG